MNRQMRLRTLALLLMGVALFSTTLIAQDRDIRAERVVLDDDGAGGTMNTLTVETADLTTNLTLTIPEPIGAGGQFLISNPMGVGGQSMTGPLTLSELRLLSATTSFYSSFISPSGMAGSLLYTLPAVQGGVNTFLRNDGSGVLSWVAAAGLTNFVESYDAVNNIAGLAPSGAAANIGVMLATKGTGALQADATDGAAAGGNARGPYAVDWQRDRFSSTAVASGDHAVIGGGFNNTASNGYSTVTGGRVNAATGFDAVVAGGGANNASGSAAIVSGGFGNTASGDYSTISGGIINRVTGSNSAILGGRNLLLTGNSSFGFYNEVSLNSQLTFSAAGTGALANVDLWLANTDNTARALRFYEPQAGPSGVGGSFPAVGTNFTAFKAGAQTADITYTLPTAAPTADGQVMTSTTTGAMSWAAGLTVDASKGIISLGSGYGLQLGDPDTNDDGILDATAGGTNTAVGYGTLRYDAASDNVQAYVSDVDGSGNDGWKSLGGTAAIIPF